MKTEFAFAIEYVADIPAARRFYSQVLGLQPRREHPTFVEFDHFAIASDEALGGDRGGTELYWLVEDAEAAFAELSRQAEVSLPLKQLPFGKVFAVKDPAGRPRYLIELAQERPSRPVSAGG
jgi:catechol 2,3-dioxygenase-like lactoylglutathione lyase family enzyme